MNSSVDLMAWHKKQGGFGGRPAGHALRALREMTEMCIAAGASREEIESATHAEIIKGELRGEFNLPDEDIPYKILEEFSDVIILMTIFQGYFLSTEAVEKGLETKFGICKQRAWTADADGVLWRPTSG
jgi:hypothetical protein